MQQRMYQRVQKFMQNDDVMEAIQHAKVLLFAADVIMVNEAFDSDCSILLQNDIHSVLYWCNANRLLP